MRIWEALVVGSLAGRNGDAGAEVDISTGLVAGAACKSDNDQGRGTQWSVGRGGGLERGDGGLWRRKGWETLGSQTPTKTGIVRWADGLPGLGRNGPPCERSTVVDAGDEGAREQALSHEYKHLTYNADAEGTAQSVAGRTLGGMGPCPWNPGGLTDTVCASSRERMRTAASWTPARRCELEPASGDGAEQRQLFMAE